MSKQAQLDVLRRQMADASLPLKETALNLVFGAGPADAKAFFIGEAPGRMEDEQGLPFVGAAGKLLDQIFAAAGLKREDIFITSILKYRPPNNRPPTLDEIKAHTPFLVEQIGIIKPAIVLPMGNFAMKFVLASFDTDRMKEIGSITDVHGKAHTITTKKHSFTAMPLYHPAAALYRRKLLDTLIEDMKKAREFV